MNRSISSRPEAPGRGRTAALAAALTAVALLAGCASGSNSASVYKSNQAQREQVVRFGTVEGVRQVSIDRGQTGVGTAGGAIVGGVAGSGIGGGRGQIITSVLGAIAGGIAGQAIENSASKRNGLEITIRMQNGELRSIVQEADEMFYVGDRVRLVSGNGVTRVTHM
ncbi:Outer membrane lipoprotein pcp precursor [Pigmentiphaga humi]|uniref:Outer membrane lipoprotein pcp n=1 Tax=Pigmentiphaga humi TaxID=2478468 RepID=A0A3P4B0C0_9BURK|nr:glycine zipper 2TM domain-containing protein [Pigmentiphaga humi]VCU69502.1 Outer membrane lipoprotein pcp precursor [Pigmentiphaga humi]